jgi:hypothetical protein
LAGPWDTRSNPIDQLSVRINEGETIAMLQILHGHVLQQGRLAGTRLAETVKVRKSILQQNSKDPAVVSKINSSQMNDLH